MLKPLLIKTDVTALGRCNGMGEMDPSGSYIKLVFHDGGENVYLKISEGCAENLIDALRGSLGQKSDAVVAELVRNARGI
jgi:phosphoribosyl-ATP pyrophosphohydrolase